jgi:alpha-tubulin suppressor-like RCC1 family protein
VTGIDSAAAISVGDHSCALTASGKAYCWGPNWYGGLGIGTVSLPQCAISAGNPPCSTTPVEVSGGLTFATISARSGHTCAVTTTGVAYCWGENNGGQLGIGVADQDKHYVPERVRDHP